MMIARIAMLLAFHCLDPRRRDWGEAMLAEYEAAEEAGQPLSFAGGCLLAALRGLPATHDGRLTLAAHALALGLFIPMGAVLISGVLLGLPYLPLGQIDLSEGVATLHGSLAAPETACRAALPPLVVLVLLLGLGHVRLAWLVLDRDWERVATLARMAAAVAATLVSFTAVLFLGDTRALLQIAVLALELAAAAGLARWHRAGSGEGPDGVAA